MVRRNGIDPPPLDTEKILSIKQQSQRIIGSILLILVWKKLIQQFLPRTLQPVQSSINIKKYYLMWVLRKHVRCAKVISFFQKSRVSEFVFLHPFFCFAVLQNKLTTVEENRCAHCLLNFPTIPSSRSKMCVCVPAGQKK